MQQQARGRGRVRYLLLDAKTKRVLQRGSFHNIITRTGLGRLDTANFTALASLVDTCKVGTGLTTPADTDTALTTLLESKDIGSVDTSNVSGSTPYTILRTQYDEDEAIGDVAEVGLFYADGGMFNHAFFGTGNITGATQANPCVITDADHGLITGQRIRIDSVAGMTQLNFSGSNYYYVSVLSSSTFSLYTDALLSSAVNSTGYGAYSSGGVWKIIIPKTSSTILVVRIEFQMANA
jgi:hypothetical protein